MLDEIGVDVAAQVLSSIFLDPCFLLSELLLDQAYFFACLQNDIYSIPMIYSIKGGVLHGSWNDWGPPHSVPSLKFFVILQLLISLYRRS